MQRVEPAAVFSYTPLTWSWFGSHAIGKPNARLCCPSMWRKTWCAKRVKRLAWGGGGGGCCVNGHLGVQELHWRAALHPLAVIAQTCESKAFKRNDAPARRIPSRPRRAPARVRGCDASSSSLLSDASLFSLLRVCPHVSHQAGISQTASEWHHHGNSYPPCERSGVVLVKLTSIEMTFPEESLLINGVWERPINVKRELWRWMWRFARAGGRKRPRWRDSSALSVRSPSFPRLWAAEYQFKIMSYSKSLTEFGLWPLHQQILCVLAPMAYGLTLEIRKKKFQANIPHSSSRF